MLSGRDFDAWALSLVEKYVCEFERVLLKVFSNDQASEFYCLPTNIGRRQLRILLLDGSI
jgi:hypothetical protein